jgi:TorA maturation chaperone TorD
MPTELRNTNALAIDLAREVVYRFLAAALRTPGEPGWQAVLDPDNQALVREAAGLLRETPRTESVPLGFGELPPEDLDLAPCLAALPGSVDELADEHRRVFGLVYTGECSPYETEYHRSGEAFFAAQQMADVAGFYRAFGLEMSASLADRPDHVALELEFVAFLLLKRRLAHPDGEPEGAERVAVCDEALQAFFRDHLSWWLPSFATALRRRAGSGFYAGAGQALAALLPLERARFGVGPPRLPLQAPVVERSEAEEEGCAGCALKV